MQSSVAGITANGIPLNTAQVAAFGATVTIDPSTPNAKALTVGSRAVAAPSLPAGGHPFTWTVNGLDVLGLPLALGLGSGLPVGAALS